MWYLPQGERYVRRVDLSEGPETANISVVATEVEGIFRLSGSAKRIKDLQDLFDAPDRYGKGLDWAGFTVHDAANVLRRYLNQLPEPIVPLSFYERFREPLCHLPNRKSVSGDEGIPPKDPPHNRDEVVATYQKLITELPSLNRQLLLYILDLLTVFAAKSDINRMTAANLAAIFQPGMLSHPDHYMSPEEYRLSQDVIVFLIENQDNFIIGMNGTAADEQTVKDVESGMAAAQQASSLRRSASNASGGADSMRKYEVTLRRNVSVSSKNSRTSAGTGSPTTPIAGRSPSGVHRSNTVPAKRHGGLSPKVLQQRDPENTSSSPAAQKSAQSSRASSRTPSRAPSINKNSISSPLSQTNFPPGSANADATPAAATQSEQQKGVQGNSVSQMPLPAATAPQPVPTPTKEKKRSSFFGWVSPPEDGRQPNRLRKKRLPTSSASESAHSSTHSLPTGSEDTLAAASASHSILASSESGPEQSSSASKVLDTITDKEKEEQTHPVTHANIATQTQGETLSKIEQSRSHASSVRSRESITDMSDADRLDEGDKKDKRRSWRMHRGSRSSRDHTPVSISSNARAEASRTSFSSATISQENVASSHRVNKDSQTNLASVVPQQIDSSGIGSPPEITSPGIEGERKGFFGKFKAKVAQVKEELKEEFREAERSKSPPHGDGEKSASRNSLSMFSRESKTGRGPSSDNLAELKPQEQRPVSTSPPQSTIPIASTTVSQTPAITEEIPEPSAAEKSVPAATANTESATTATATVLTTVEEDVPLTIPPPSETIAATAPPPPSSVVVPEPSTDKAEAVAKEPEAKELTVKAQTAPASSP